MASNKPTSGLARAKTEIEAMNRALRAGNAPPGNGRGRAENSVTVAARWLKLDKMSLLHRVGYPDRPGSHKRDFGIEPDWSLYLDPKPPSDMIESPFAIEHAPQVATATGAHWELVSRPDNTFCFGAMGDLHAASKYTRWEVREDLMRRAEAAGAQCIFDTGNWIDGEKPFNRYDLEAVGLDAQCRMLADRYPRSKLETFAVAGDDHEGWYIKSEGIDVGRYCESIMRDAGHKWTNLGYMEADIVLRNANSGATAILRVVHPGGGTGYALSYRPQKIIESYEGGEKPAVVLFGHYHKLDCNNVRNVWSVQTGCQQDQTPFMRKKSLEAHVGGAIVEMEQDPKTGAIIGFKPELRRYFNRAYYVAEGRANNRWSGHGKVNMIPRKVGTIR